MSFLKLVHRYLQQIWQYFLIHLLLIHLSSQTCQISEKGKESQRKAQKKYAQTEKGKETRKRASDKSAKRLCYDPKKENFCTYATLRSRVKCHPDLYKDVNLLECVIK